MEFSPDLSGLDLIELGIPIRKAGAKVFTQFEVFLPNFKAMVLDFIHCAVRRGDLLAGDRGTGNRDLHRKTLTLKSLQRWSSNWETDLS